MRRAFENLLKSDAVAAAPSPAELTAAETRIVEMAIKGARNKEIADQLQLSESTVKNHLHSVYVKLNVNSRRDLVRWYEKTQLR